MSERSLTHQNCSSLIHTEQRRLQEQERQHLAKIERQRQELLADHLVIETRRLDQEK